MLSSRIQTIKNPFLFLIPWLRSQPPGRHIPAREIGEYAVSECVMSLRACERWLSSQAKNPDVLEKVSRGIYKLHLGNQ